MKKQNKMLVTELVKKINFNDSCVNELICANGTVILDIDLCMWKQREYQDGDPELKEVILKFLNSTRYNWDSEKTEKDIDYDSIVDITYKESIVKIVLEDEDVSILTFECSEVQIDWIVSSHE